MCVCITLYPEFHQQTLISHYLCVHVCHNIFLSILRQQTFKLFPHLGYSEKEHESTDNSSVFLVNTAMQIDKLQKLTLSYTVQMHSQASFKFTVLAIIFKGKL